jgi:zinc transporter
LNAPAVNPTTSHYGADAGGLISGFLVSLELPAQAIDAEQAAVWLDSRLAQGRPAGEDDEAFLWLHFSLAHTGCLPWLHEHATLASEFFTPSATGCTRRASSAPRSR